MLHVLYDRVVEGESTDRVYLRTQESRVHCHRANWSRTVQALRVKAASLAPLLVYLGLSLLGWGLGDLRGHFVLGPRVAYALLVGVFAIAVAIQSYSSLAGRQECRMAEWRSRE